MSHKILKEGNLKVNLETGKVYKNKKEVILTPTELSILKLLWLNKGKVFKIEAIYEHVWEQSNTLIITI